MDVVEEPEHARSRKPSVGVVRVHFLQRICPMNASGPSGPAGHSTSPGRSGRPAKRRRSSAQRLTRQPAVLHADRGTQRRKGLFREFRRHELSHARARPGFDSGRVSCPLQSHR